MKGNVPKIPAIICGIFKEEFSQLPPELTARFDPVFIDSMLHMEPERLDGVIAGFVKARSRGVIVYGDCCPNMAEYGNTEGFTRTRGVNCCELMLGRTRYRRLSKAKTFFFMPEWVSRWKEVFEKELGFSRKEIARGFMTDSLTQLCYVDTGVSAPPEKILRDIREFFSMPFSVERCSVLGLQKELEHALRQVTHG